MTVLRETFFDVTLGSILLPTDAVVLSVSSTDKPNTVVVYYTSKRDMFQETGVTLKRVPVYVLNVGDEVPDNLIGQKPRLVEGKRFLFLS